MLDTKLLSDEELYELFSEPLSEQEAENMIKADDVAHCWFVLALNGMPNFIIVE